jgi:hypothetical protein
MTLVDGVTLEHVIAELEGKGKTKTLRDFFEGSFFSTVKTAQDPRFPGATKVGRCRLIR